ncbi:MAG: hypothetical protein QOE23_3409, partial [Pseudonocardiales bacterium]|nr:hypothetical protein [Pseudonocardiales bacterium]
MGVSCSGSARPVHPVGAHVRRAVGSVVQPVQLLSTTDQDHRYRRMSPKMIDENPGVSNMLDHQERAIGPGRFSALVLRSQQ